ncbi:hypothetical protein [Chitinophaga sp. Cy-1792]|uniref:MutS-related protein n=1 Tax=Chitinophaga sp. Cy-1792 TaxID=2608339 RepID=UPI00141F0D1F|nr:hypothetical protein [Chitinophaga sp. Cy-1792]NIG52111.1 hypothetical protein [Chitinophaga sp. Cy-1792]
MTLEETYQQRINTLTATIAAEKSRLSSLGWLRLFSFLLAGLGFIQFFRTEQEFWWLPLGILGLILFGWLLKAYLRLQDKLQLTKALLSLNEKELALVVSNISGFDDGGRYADEKHDFTSDLDVFGHASVYQHINRTGSISGSDLLAERLRNPLKTAADIVAVQESLKVLAPELEFRQLLAATASLSGEEQSDKREINLWLQMPLQFLGNKFWEIVRWVTPVLFIGAIIVYALTGDYAWSVIMLFVNYGLLLSAQKHVQAQHNLMAHKARILGKFDSILQVIRGASFGNAQLLKEQQGIANEAGSALRKLGKIAGALDQRMNLLVGFVLNPLVMYDIHCIVGLEKWKRQHKDDLNKWLDVVAKLEVWNSLATFSFNHQEYCWPVPGDGKLVLDAKALGHPLIPAAECIANDGSVGTKADFLIITGSNMSGKSTFLRSVGSNLLLAMVGAPVCAKAFSFVPMGIMTSMRIKDSIASHTSYFQAELLRLQHIILALKTGKRVFVLLDEILKGTNSEDKLSGSRSLIEHFIQYECLGMIATHDLELGHMEDTYPTRIRNYCFESTIQGDDLYFDYRIREGIARNKNATFLMKQMQII